MTFQGDNFDEITLPLRVIVMVTLFLLWGILAPISIVYGFRFWVFRQCQVLKKRYSFIACIEILFVLVGFFTNGLVILADSLQSVWLRQCAFHSTILVQYGIMYCWLWRFWLIYYDMNWMVLSLSVEWRRLINPHSRTSLSYEPSWFLDHKHSFGNRRWVGQRIAVFVVLISVITITVRYLFDFTEREPIGEAIYLFFYFVPFVGLGVLRCKLPDFKDSIYIQQEMKYIMALLVLILLAFAVQEVAEDSFESVSNTQLIINILFYVAIEVCNFLCILITTRYVLRKVSILLSEQMKAAAGAQSKAAVDVDYVPLKGHDDDDGGYDGRCSVTASRQILSDELSRCLSNESSFDLFLRFLAKEFSVECLLSYVEFVQFKQYQAKRKRAGSKGTAQPFGVDERGRRDTDLDVVFPASVPHSEIVYDEEGDISIKAKIYKFYRKYIESNSEFEINILDSSRQRLVAVLGDYTEWMGSDYYDEVGLFHFYDGCISEMKALLMASFKRFKALYADELDGILAE